MNADTRIGFALCGSFCTFERVIQVLEGMTVSGMDVYPIMSEISAATDTRFGRAADFEARIEKACGHPVIKTIHDAEPIGPKKLLDVLVVRHCGQLRHARREGPSAKRTARRDRRLVERRAGRERGEHRRALKPPRVLFRPHDTG